MRARRAMLAASSIVLLGVAIWMRGITASPLPRTAQRSDEGMAALRGALAAEVRQLDALAVSALGAPAGQADALDYLEQLGARRGFESVVLSDTTGPVAWAGTARTRADARAGTVSVTQSPFFTVINVARVSAGREAVASALVAAEPPASRLTAPLAESLEIPGLAGFEFRTSPASDSSARPAQPVLTAAGRALLFAVPIPRGAAEAGFAKAARERAVWGFALLVGYLLFLAAGWARRRDLPVRLFAIGVGLALTGLVPWSEFSNTSRAFDPGFYFSRVGGPYTANAAALLTTVMLLLMAVFAVSRARRFIVVPRRLAALLSVVTLLAGLALASNIVRGVGQPSWGSTPGLWLSWELPGFLFLFSVVIAAASLARLSWKGSGTLRARTIIATAFAAAIVATAALWVTTTRQRMRLAERDLSALTRVDESEETLVRRFLDSLSEAPAPKSAADLLKLYASSELSAAEFPVVLESRDADGKVIARLDLAPGATDSSSMAYAASAPLDSGATMTFLGPTGVQALGRVVHSSGEKTLAVVLPHTRLVAQPAFAQLIGIVPPAEGEPPYTASFADVSPGVAADAHHVEWRKIGDEWHGDRLIPTSFGTKRAHVEVDLRSFSARAERGALIVLLDVLLAGALWLSGALVEKPFRRWLRYRFRQWLHTYRARLTVALFAFFVVPAVAFGLWSYQRLRSDDRQTRELLVNESLASLGEGRALEDLSLSGRKLDAPLFLYASGFLSDASDSLFAQLAPGGLAVPAAVQKEIGVRGEIFASSLQDLGGKDALFGYRAVRGPNEERYVIAAPARGDDLVLDRRRRDLGMLVLFAIALGAVAALWLSGLAAKRLARDLELSRIEVARAERVIAWGEMARQVAHEIKNPLTPIRLGVQHLRRARQDNRPDFDKVLDENVGRILSEIDRLDSIARSFSRYGSAPADLLPAERLDVAAVARDVVALEQMGKGEVRWRLRGADGRLVGMARSDELREVMLNILENARLAGARKVDITLRGEDKRVTIEISDDGAGIPAAVLPKIFEPHFSTRTTGSGLGLPMSRRIIEHWGGEIAVTSEEGNGARVLIALARPSA